MMTVPQFEDIMLPLLKFLSDNQEKNYSQVMDHLSDLFNLSQEDLAREKSTGGNVFYDRITWSKTYLTRAGILKRHVGRFQISPQGLQILEQKPLRIDRKYLRQLETAEEPEQKRVDDELLSDTRTPNELISDGISQINDNLTNELLKMVKAIEPIFFEKLIVHLVEKMGYGKAKHVGKPGDGGIDGEVRTDRLGLHTIYLQAKRYSDVVPTDDVRKFMGSLSVKQSKDGIFITTSDFRPNAYDEVEQSDKNVILINGKKLVENMIETGMGVKNKETIIIKEIDNDYLPE